MGRDSSNLIKPTGKCNLPDLREGIPLASGPSGMLSLSLVLIIRLHSPKNSQCFQIDIAWISKALTQVQGVFKGSCAGGLYRFQVPCCQSPCFCSIEKNDNNFGNAANLRDKDLPTGSFTAIYLPLSSHPDSTWRHLRKSGQITSVSSVTNQALLWPASKNMPFCKDMVGMQWYSSRWLCANDYEGYNDDDSDNNDNTCTGNSSSC